MSKPKTEAQLALMLAALALASCDATYIVDAKDIADAQALCDAHQGTTKLDARPPIDVFCKDGTQIRYYGHGK